MPNSGEAEVYDRLMRDVWGRMVNILGIHTVLVLVQRACWTARQSFDEAALIDIAEQGVDFARLRRDAPDKAQAVAEEFLASLTGIMTRLIGLEMSRKIAQELDEWFRDQG